MQDKGIEDLLARESIRGVLANYCRGLDRMDKPLALSVWHEDATALYHDIYEGTGYGFVEWVWEAHAGMARHSHQIANSLITIDGATACSETYVTVALWTLPDAGGKQQEIIGRGRYLDSWSKRQGKWAIAHREHILDMQSLQVLTPGYVNAQATRDASDPSYRVLGQA